MDSWTDKQMALMKGGGNQKCNDYLKKHGIDPRAPIKQKYDNDVAQLYKEVLKARVEGRPEPKELPKPAQRKAYVPSPASGGFGGIAGGGGSGGGGDPKGMERLPGETDQQYIARQTRLRDEAKARMAAKFGGQGMGGVGSGGGRGGMSGIGSDPNYNPNGGYGGGFDVGVDTVVNGLGSVFSYATSIVNDDRTRQLTNSVKTTGAGFWSGITSTVQSAAQGLAQPEGFNGDDGLADLQKQIQQERSVRGPSKYTGVGSDSYSRQPPTSSSSLNSMGSASSGGSGFGGMNGSGNSAVGEAPGLPGEDRNGVERLTGETDEQYVARQTRIRDEAKARMAAKFGGGGMSGVGSGMSGIASSGFGGGGSRSGSASPPRSGNAPSFAKPAPTKSTPSRKLSGDDFFSSFGT